MMICINRGTAFERPYCKRYGYYCDIWRLLWCKRDIFFAVFMAGSIAFFAYGLVAAWQNTEDRVDLQRKIKDSQMVNQARMDILEQMILDEQKRGQALDDTVARHWKALDKKLKELKPRSESGS